MMWWELAASVCHFTASMVFLALAIKSRAVSRRIWGRDDKVKRLKLSELNPYYWNFKWEVDKYFVGEGKDKLASIRTTVSKLLEGDLTRSPLSLTRCQQSKDLELNLAQVFASIVNRFAHKAETEQVNTTEAKTVACMLFQVTSFFLKTEMVPFLFDLKGYRRWCLTVAHLQRAIDLHGSASETSSCSGVSSCISKMSTLIPRPFLCSCCNCDPEKSVADFKPYLFTQVRLRLQLVVIPIVLIIWDNWSDGRVLFNYANIWILTNSSLLMNSTDFDGMTGGGTPEISFAIILLSLIIMFSTLTILTSVFGISSTSCSARALTQGLQTAEMMAEPRKPFAVIDYWGLASRFQLTIAEAWSESLAQHMVQWAAYFSITLLLAGSNSSAEYDEYLTFRTLGISGLASVTALTLSQVKINDIFHEFTLSQSQKLVYTLASLINTLSHTTLLVFICTIMFDLVFLIAAKTNFLWALLSLLLLFLLFLAIYFVTFYWGKAVRVENDLRIVRGRPMLGTNTILRTNYNNQVVRKFLYHAENLFCHLRLPTSVSNLANQPICYQTACDARTVLLTSFHYFTLHLYFLLSCLLLVAQQLGTHLDPSIVAPTYQLFSARHNLLLVSFSLPFAFMAALLLLHIYLKGTFLCNSQYLCYPETCWFDLGPVSFSLLTTFGLKLPDDVVVSSNNSNGLLQQQQRLLQQQ